ncbi:outer membrane receptor for ferrienterochelin and colicins [Psychroflexus salarius]|uniref:Outer membrane receptor for ferrienterochelin and colicins n=1 Tax=Psychroflexus salarius TaxID=1155689 RepID=A0A1M4XMG1_9FLAO|nr:TonB-dependent receptor [Psychroflexus salarius]SHE94443.1 outer membrane receptor for ferrienterochelin and colicins [Psychroflexus salarius]
MKFKSLVINCLFLMFGVLTYAQVEIDTTQFNQLDEVILTATRTERQLSSLPMPVTLVSKKTINQSGSVRLDEILREQTGIVTVTDESGFEGVQMQGIASDYILILIDGVPLVGRSAGNFDLSRLTVGNIKQIEVVKGPSSSLYGSEALGGVINIITEKPSQQDLEGSASYRIGRFSQQDINLELSQAFDQLRYSVFMNRFSSQGYDLNTQTEGQTVNPFENYTLNARVYYDFSDRLKFSSSTRFFNENQDIGFSNQDEAFNGDTQQNEWNLHTKLDHELSSDFEATYELYYTSYKVEESVFNSTLNSLSSANFFNQQLLRPEVRTNLRFNEKGILTTGLGYQYESLDRTFFDDQVNFNSQYLYAQYDVDLLDQLNIIAGLRFDNHSEYSNQLSPKLAMRYQFSDQLALKASVGRGFKAPDFRQLYFDFLNSAVGYVVLGYNVAADKLEELQNQGQILETVVSQNELNQDLDAESSTGYNLGFTYKRDRWNAELNFFRNDFTNLIDTRIIARLNNGQNVFSYVNFDEVFTTGLEFNSNIEVTKNFTLNAGYQLLYAYDKTNLDRIENNQVFVRNPANNQTELVSRSDYFGLVNRSRHNANLKLFYDLPKLETDVSLRLLYRSKYAQFDTNGNGLIDTYDTSFVNGFATVNFAASKQFFNDFRLQIGANNLLDYTDANIPSMPGIQGFVKLNYQF